DNRDTSHVFGAPSAPPSHNEGRPPHRHGPARTLDRPRGPSMSQRERPAPRGSPAARPADRPAPMAGPGTPVAWDDLYDRLPPDRRARLLASAAESGAVP